MLYLVFDGPSPVVQVVAVSQHVHHLPVPKQGDVVPRLGLRGKEEKEINVIGVFEHPQCPQSLPRAAGSRDTTGSTGAACPCVQAQPSSALLVPKKVPKLPP